MSSFGELIVLPSLRGWVFPNGRVRITGKFADGMRHYAAKWPGRVVAVLHPDDQDASGNLDDVSVSPAELPFGLEVIPYTSEDLLYRLRQAHVVQGGPDYLLNDVPEFCAREGIPYVFVSEYTLRTRWEIIDAATRNPLLRLRRRFWEWRQERVNRRNAKLAAAVQCNGTPTFDAYSPLNHNTLLYFDSRTSESMHARSPALAARTASIRAGAPIRLAFSGRLNEMKGADDLIRVAIHLRKLGVPFELDICGSGTLSQQLKRDIDAAQLSSQVRLRGVLDFERELVPFIQSEIDLFVCCHRQGDPSCTYLETMACGVPIAGYANEAFSGLMSRCAAGWAVPMNRPKRLAEVIARIHAQPEMLLEAATAGLAFAKEHCAQRAFDARVQQMMQLVRRHSQVIG